MILDLLAGVVGTISLVCIVDITFQYTKLTDNYYYALLVFRGFFGFLGIALVVSALFKMLGG